MTHNSSLILLLGLDEKYENLNCYYLPYYQNKYRNGSGLVFTKTIFYMQFHLNMFLVSQHTNVAQNLYFFLLQKKSTSFSPQLLIFNSRNFIFIFLPCRHRKKQKRGRKILEIFGDQSIRIRVKLRCRQLRYKVDQFI